MRRALVLLLALTAAACASAPIKKADVLPLAAADAKVLEGCYDCLLEARATYERVGVGKARPLVITRLFETQLLIALREKELAIDSTAAIARARELAAELPAAAEANRYVAVVDLVTTDNVGTPRREASTLRLAQAPAIAGVTAEVAWIRTATAVREPVRQYLSMALDCSYLSRAGRQPALQPLAAADLWTGSTAPREAPPGTPPLVTYRMAICNAISEKGLAAVRSAVPKFAEGAFFLARGEVANAPTTGGAKARDFLAEAYQRFPNSASITYLSGNYNQLIGDCREAVRFYDETIRMRSVHEDALLGRTMCLTFLKRTDEAIAEASHIIDLKLDNWGEAYYWRAWNQHFLARLPLARTDIERAKTLAGSERVFTLAGIIEHDQDDLDIAESDLTLAKRLNRQNRNCTAMWYLGLVRMKREAWLESGKHFDDAYECYSANVTEDENGLKVVQARTDLEPDFRARQIAGFEAALVEDRRQQHAGAFNAANFNARGGNVVRARVLLDIAAADPSLADKVAQLRQILKDK